MKPSGQQQSMRRANTSGGGRTQTSGKATGASPSPLIAPRQASFNTQGSPQVHRRPEILGPPCLEQYLSTESSWITANSNMFEPGDVLDANPEPENSPYWDDNHGVGWTYENNDAVAVPDFNQFLIDVTTTANTALAAAGIHGVITGVRSLSESFAETNGGLEQSTIDALGYLTIDSYPDQNFVPCNGGSGSCDQTYANDAASAWSTQLGDIVSDQQAARGNSRPVPILIGRRAIATAIPPVGQTAPRSPTNSRRMFSQMSTTPLSHTTYKGSTTGSGQVNRAMAVTLRSYNRAGLAGPLSVGVRYSVPTSRASQQPLPPFMLKR